jgi:hypothetical protein
MSGTVRFDLKVWFDRALDLLTLSRAISTAMASAGVAPRTWGSMGSGDAAPGGQPELERYVATLEEDMRCVFSFEAGARMHVLADREKDAWLAHFSSFGSNDASGAMQDALAIIANLREAPGLLHLKLRQSVFPCSPPLAQANYAVTVTDAEVVDAYEDPAVFWRAWEKIEPYGDKKLCLRALGELDLLSWLGKTFETTMALARAAKPGKTGYSTLRPSRSLSAWWDFGPWDEDKAGEPTLSPVRYDEATRMLEFAAYVPPKRHVLAQEIHLIRTLALKKKDGKGRPIDEIQIVFIGDTPEATARAERRPLRDVGARTFFLRPDGTRAEVM